MAIGSISSSANHPQRNLLSSEMHMRKLPRFATPAHIIQFVYTLAHPAGEEAMLSALEKLDSGFPHDGSSRFHAGSLGTNQLCWEMHSEFCTVTLIASGEEGDPLELSGLRGPISSIARLPDQIIRSTNIAIVEVDDDGRDWSHYFAEEDLVISEVMGGRARVWCDFRLHDDGFGRMLIEDRGLVGREPADLVQSLQELGNYRKMALLGLPVAKEAMAQMDALEARLAGVSLELVDEDASLDKQMRALSRISADLAGLAANTRYRMAATRAYAAIVEERLAQLNSSAEPGQISLTQFTERRLLPAVRTCEAFSRRLKELTRHAAEVSDLLRTVIDTELARRNAELLTSMDRRTELQLRLQQTVEGLSIVAITYYVLGIWKYVGDHGPMPVDHTVSGVVLVSLAVLSPLAIWLLLHRAKRHRPG